MYSSQGVPDQVEVCYSTHVLEKHSNYYPTLVIIVASTFPVCCSSYIEMEQALDDEQSSEVRSTALFLDGIMS